MQPFKIKLFLMCFLAFLVFKSQASTVYEIDNAVYLECNTCFTTTEFKILVSSILKITFQTI